MNRPSSRESIISINIDGKLNTLLELKMIIDQLRPIACLIQDLPGLRNEEKAQVFNIIAESYEVICSENSSKVSNLILVDKEKINIRQIHVYNNKEKANALGASIEWDDENNIDQKGLVLFSVYIRPRTDHRDTEKCLNWIDHISSNNEGHSRTIIAGDFNCSHPTWCPLLNITDNRENSEGHYNQIKITRGRYIANFMKRLKLSCLNRIDAGPSFLRGNQVAYIDLAFIGNKANRRWNSMRFSPVCDSAYHKAIIIENSDRITGKIRRKEIKKIKVDRLNQQHFTELILRCEMICKNWRQLPRDRIKIRLDILVGLLYKAVLNAQECITLTIQYKSIRKRHKQLGYNLKVRNQLKRLSKHNRKLRSLSARLKSLTNDRVVKELKLSKAKLKRKFNKLKNRILNLMDNNQLHSQNDDLSEQELWTRVETIDRYRTRNSRNNLERDSLDLITTQQDIDLLAESKFPLIPRDTIDSVDYASKDKTYKVRVNINRLEIDYAIKNLAGKTYTSPEGIKMVVFAKALDFIPNIIRTIAEMSFWICYIPKECRITQGTLIPKKTRGQFRIVHVSSPIAALLETIALKRLEYRLEINNLNSPFQFGFSALRSRQDLMARIIELCYKHNYTSLNQTRACTIIISLDIEGAFDNINQDKLIYKMNDEIDNDPIRFWLTEFILNRNISIKKGKLRSKPRSVCLGVPQGSALGPILWNYAIHDLDKGITWAGRIELLRYADDIILLYNGYNMIELQQILDDIVNKLATIDLSIRPEKCSTMAITLGSSRDRRKHEYKIGNATIKQVKTMNILGIPINNKLKLNTRSKEHEVKLLKSVKRLHSLNEIGLINSAAEWRILIDSFIKSRLIINNWSVLLVDKRARIWTDNRFIRMLRIIFEWPSNTSIKLIRMLTKSVKVKLDVQRMAGHNETMELGKIYYFLEKLTIENNRNEYALIATHNDLETINLETDILTRRKHFNPNKILSIKQIDSISEEMNRYGPGWFLLDKASGSMMTEMLFDKVKQIRVGKHYDYQISYFNSFALLNKLTSESTVEHKCLFISGDHSILKAIQNLNNHDYRVIQLREQMCDNKWRVNIINKEEASIMNEYLHTIYKKLVITTQKNLSDGQSIDNNLDSNRCELETIFEPNLSDYKARNSLNLRITRENNDEFNSYHTELTRHLCYDVTIWQTLTPNWISGKRLMALSGLHIDNDTNMLMHTGGKRERCSTCNEENQETSIIWQNIHQLAVENNMILHRMVECSGFDAERTAFVGKVRINMILEAIDNRYEMLNYILKNKRTSQSLLTFIAQCAFKVRD